MRLTRKYRFSASHRLHSAVLSEAENQRLYGKCNNPYGHGHDYTVEVSVRGPLDTATGRVVDLARLDQLVGRRMLARFDHKNLNADVPELSGVVPTTENLAREIGRSLEEVWSTEFPGGRPRLEKIRVAETDRNLFELNLLS